jgi:hypothetical protein
VISADKMMNRAKGPVWHKKQKDKGIVPKKLRALDKEATWGKSNADGWVYGHGSFTLTSHKVPFLGSFIWMKNSANEAKKMWLETGRYKDLVDYVAMDSKADDCVLFKQRYQQRRINLVTCCRKNMDKTQQRRAMISVMNRPKFRQIYKERAKRVEPMQGLVKEIFDLDRCWMKGNESNRWLFAAMGLTIQMHQLKAYHEKRSTWKIKEEVLG